MFLSILKKPVTLKKYQLIALLIGCTGFFVLLLMLSNEAKKASQYLEMNVFLEKRIKDLQGERNKLETAIQEAIETGINQNKHIEKAHEDDLQKNKIIADSLPISEHERLFKNRFGELRQYKSR